MRLRDFGFWIFSGDNVNDAYVFSGYIPEQVGVGEVSYIVYNKAKLFSICENSDHFTVRCLVPGAYGSFFIQKNRIYKSIGRHMYIMQQLLRYLKNARLADKEKGLLKKFEEQVSYLMVPIEKREESEV